MIRPLLLVLLLIASPAWAIPVLTGTADRDTNGAGNYFWSIVTADFAGNGGSDIGSHWHFQGQDFCTTQGVTDCNGGPAKVGGLAIVNWGLPCVGCLTAPADIHGEFHVFGPTFTTFSFAGTGVATFRIDGPNNIPTFLHADFSPVQTPEPGTWLLLMTGLMVIGFSRFARSRV